MTRLKNLSLVLVSAFAVVFTGCKYEEGPAISLRNKRDRVANEWKISGYQINGTEDAAACISGGQELAKPSINWLQRLAIWRYFR